MSAAVSVLRVIPITLLPAAFDTGASEIDLSCTGHHPKIISIIRDGYHLSMMRLTMFEIQIRHENTDQKILSGSENNYGSP